jgi:hypothetical protein
MAFSSNGLTPVYLGGAGGLKEWYYVTTDSVATVSASGYFNDAEDLMEIGEVVNVRVVDIVAPNTRTSLTQDQKLYVASNDGTTVTTSIPVSGTVITTTATVFSLTQALHHGKTVVWNAAASSAITLPTSTGGGMKFRIVVGVAATGTAHTIKVAAGSTDDMQGGLAIFDTSATDIMCLAFAATATDDTITLNGTTQAGTRGTTIELEDVEAGLWSVRVVGAATGSYATPFSATV